MAFTLGLLLIFGELSARGVLWARFPDWEDAIRPPAIESAAELHSGECLHPYYGLAYDPLTHPTIEYGTRAVPNTELGLAGLVPPVAPRRSDRLRIGVLGGSFAWQFAVAGAQRLADRLQSHPAYGRREVEVVSLAAVTFKQPQQVMVLNYALALGAEFDVLLNLDGYNELALAQETAADGVYFAYPRMWLFRTYGRSDPRLLELSARLQQWRVARQAVVERLRTAPLRHVGLVRLWWVWSERRAAAAIHEISSAMRDEVLAHGVGFERRGPPNAPRSEGEFLDDCAALWRRASLQLHAVAEGHNCLYLHVLQPNQYVPDSKPLSPRERQEAYDDTSRQSQIIREGYPRLLAEGATLATAGVRFIDLTRLFADVTESVYVDPCCHLNATGYELVAERLADEILTRLPRTIGSETSLPPEGAAGAAR